MKKAYLLLASTALLIGLSSCIKDDLELEQKAYYPEELTLLNESLNLPDYPLDYTIELPRHIANTGLFARAINRDMATLGRVIFYDKALSATGDVSCASCHKQEYAFADTKALSDGVNNNVTDRNSLALGSVVSFASYYGSTTNTFGSFAIPFMWDNRFATAAEQAEAAVTNSKEMGLTNHELVDIVKSKAYYAPLFRRAYGLSSINEVTKEHIYSAVAEFVDGLGSYESKFDVAAKEETTSFNTVDYSKPFDGLSAAENEGKDIYVTHCASCHSASFGRPALSKANNGLDMHYTDQGVGGANGSNADDDLFKVPTLRNIALTAPYMHDGRFESLRDVVDFYSDDIANHPKLDARLKEFGQAKRLNLSNSEKEALISFLETLTDYDYLSKERYSNPFKE